MYPQANTVMAQGETHHMCKDKPWSPQMSVYKYKHTQVHKVIYPRSDTYTLPKQVLLPMTRAELSSVPTGGIGGGIELTLGKKWIFFLLRACPLRWVWLPAHLQRFPWPTRGPYLGDREDFGGSTTLKPWHSLGT